VAVLIAGYGEIEDYADLDGYNERSVRLLVSKSVKFPEPVIPRLTRLLSWRTEREWRKAGDFTSPHNEIFEAQRAGIERHLRQRFGDRVGVFKSYNFSEPFLPEQVLEEIRSEGFRRLVIYPLLVVDSIYTGGLTLEQVNTALGNEGGWVEAIRYLPSFFERPEYHDRIARHIEQGLDRLEGSYAPSQIGLVLLNHGCPLNAKGYESGVRESEALFHSIRERLVSKYPLISVGWMNHPTPGKWTSPNIDLAAENLLTMGARALVFAPVGFVTDNHETLLDVGYLIDDLQGRAELLQLDCLNEDPEFLEMAAAWIAPLVEELLQP
jgi:ferrochelatase